MWWGFTLGVLSSILGMGVFVFLGFPEVTNAVSVIDPSSGLGFASDTDLIETIVAVVRWALGLMALVAVIMIIYGGFVWMTAGGNADRVDRAKKILLNAVIGLIVVMLSLAITFFVMNTINDAINGSLNDGDPPGGGGDLPRPFTLDWYTPVGENVTDCVAQLKFSRDPEAASFERGFSVRVRGGLASGSTCTEHRQCASDLCDANVCSGDRVAGSSVVLTGAHVAVFTPTKLFSLSTTFDAEAQGGGLGGIVAADDGTALNETVRWSFSTAAQVDETPPRVEQVAPSNTASDVSRECSLQVRFSKNMLISTLLDSNALKLQNNPTLTFDKSFEGARYFSATPTNPMNESETQKPLLESSIITDTCGNFLDGDSEGTEHPDYPDPDDQDANNARTSWTFATGTSLSCVPEITDVLPDPDTYDESYRGGSSLFIRGKNLGIFGEATFNNGVTVGPTSRLCMGSDRAPRGAGTNVCIADNGWSDTLILFNGNAPSSGGGSNGTVTGDVRVRVGNHTSNPQRLEIASPYIQRMNPSRGPAGTFVTLNGSQFGTSRGRVYVRKESDPSFKAEAEYVCSDQWLDTQVVVALPQGIAEGDYYLQIETTSGMYSNGNMFRVNTDPLAPGICPWEESCGEVGQGKTISGRFTARDGNDAVLLNGNDGTEISSWNDAVGTITFALSDQLRRGNNDVRIRDNGLESNALDITSPCDVRFCDGEPLTPQCNATPGLCSGNETCNPNNCECTEAPFVVHNGTCDPEGLPSPNPRPDDASVCLNSRVHVMFSEGMDNATLNTQNIIVEDCGEASGNFDVTKCSQVPTSGILRISDFGFPGQEGVTIDPETNTEQNFTKHHWYRVRLTTAIRADSGFPLQEEYSWRFRTRDTDALCEANRVDVEPGGHTFNEATDRWQEFTGVPSGENCQILELTGAYDWRLEPSGAPFGLSEDTSELATVTTEPENGSTNLIARFGTAEGSSGIRSEFSGMHCDANEDCNTAHDGRGTVCSESQCINNFCTPDITTMDPNDGAVSDYVSVLGCFFGTYLPGTSKVEFTDLADGRVEGLLPLDQCSESSVWDPNFVRVQVPNGAASGNVYLTSGTLPLNPATNPNFEVNTATDAMNYACIEPVHGPHGSGITLKGERFGVSQGRVKFTLQGEHDAAVSAWSDTEIQATVSYDAVVGVNATSVVRADSEVSNPIDFRVEEGGYEGDPCSSSPIQCSKDQDRCQEGLICNDSCTCEPETPGNTDANPNIILKNPSPNELNVCPNRSILIRFDQGMQHSSLSEETIQLIRTHGEGECKALLSASWWKVALSRIQNLLIPRALANHDACQVDYRVELHDIEISQGVVQTEVTVTPEQPMARYSGTEMNYRVRVVGGPDGVKAENGLPLAIGNIPVPEVTWEFRTAEQLCELAENQTSIVIKEGGQEVVRLGSSDLYTCSENSCSDDLDSGAVGNQHRYLVAGLTSDGDPLQFGGAEGQLSADWEETNLPDNVTSLSEGPSLDSRVGTIDSARSSGTENIGVTVEEIGTDLSEQSDLTITLMQCDDPWPETGTFPTSGGDDADFQDFHFSSMYCKDAMEEPFTVQPYSDEYLSPQDPEVNELLADFYVRSPDTTGAVGIRIYENELRLSAKEWFKAMFPGVPTGQETTVGGYPAIQFENAVYVSFADRVSGGTLYARIMLIQISEDASSTMQNIYQQLRANMTYNTNLTTSEREKITRDLLRINDISDAANATYQYYKANGVFPDLTSGSFIEGHSTSKWPVSWSLLSNELGTTLGKDPLNTFNDPDTQCPIANGFDPNTCWDDDEKIFFCPDGSHVYHYRVQNRDNNVFYYGALEYTEDGSWTNGDYDPCSDVDGSQCSCYNYQVEVDTNGFYVFGDTPQ